MKGTENGWCWRKATASGNTNSSDCVEIADRRDFLAVRDSKNASGPMLTFEPGAWTAFRTWIAR
ncbi:DUF397 domain-containing protein [Lentzea sp. HUAS12]|uniref:DUF397 domain-containing protein n=1 Tax=Lentzea sp. HUAS12 TaxID=2951806 RepID=UPI0020A1BA15|nr:DUF397 domain-containing protein [Lentzea sp. HUAS12]USX56448.1 DUF397 domain-containing protein [Lentzea sp. HUAS12]